MIRKYNLTSVTMDKFFLGPLPQFDISSHCMPVRPPSVNGCLSITSPPHPASDHGVAFDDITVIDLTDDSDVLTLTAFSSTVAETHVEPVSHSARKNHVSKPG